MNGNTVKILFSKLMLRELPDFILKFIPLYFILIFISRPKWLWLISERPDDARDNGYVFFKWLRENYPELQVYYAIKKSSVDYPKVERLGNVIEWASWEHFRKYITASVLCSTQSHFGAPVFLPIRAVRKIMPVKGKKVFLQHGIIKDDLRYCHKDKLRADLFVCGAFPEWKYVSENFGYSNGETKYLGLARYDYLEDANEKKQILFMPTWRMWLERSGKEEFERSSYFRALSEFLSSAELSQYLQDSGAEFIFYLHPNFKRMKSSFERFESGNITVRNSDDIDLQILLKSCSMLITDFSSIAFDVAYMDKPVIYYQFDEEAFRQGHYAEGYFSYTRDGFGPVLNSSREVLSYVEKLDKAGFINPEQYSQRTERFFKFRDRNNCLRHYNAICDLQ